MSRKAVVRSIKNERRSLVKAAQESFLWVGRRGMSSDIRDYREARENLALFETCFGAVL